MNKIRILLVEDDLFQKKRLNHLLIKHSYCVEAVSTAEMAIQLALKIDFDLYILDIDLCESMDGISLSKILKSIQPSPIVFFSGCEDVIIWQKCFEIKPEAILVKPCRNKQILITIESLSNRLKKTDPEKPFAIINHKERLKKKIYLKDKECFHKVDLENIEKIVSDQGVIHFHLVNKSNTYTISSGLKEFQDQFPFEELQRVNKSCIINLNHLEKFNKNYVWVNGIPITLGEKYKKDFYDKVNILKTGWNQISN